MKLITLILELVVFTALAFAVDTENKINYQSIVLPLNKGNFTEIINKAPQVLVKFYSPSCYHCKELAPIYSEVAEYVREKNVRVVIAEVDCNVERDICMEQKITKYPTVLFFKEGELYEEYEGKRTKEAISEFVIEKSRAIINIVHKDEVKEFITKFKTDKENLIIGYFNRIGDKDYKVFEKIAKKLSKEYIFAAAGDEQAALEAGGVVVPGIVMYKKYDEAIERNSKITEENVLKFIKLHKIPNVQELTKDNYQMYLDTNIPLAIFYYEKDAQFKKHFDDLFHISKLYRDRLYFVGSKTMLLDKNKFNKLPFFGVFDPKQPDLFFPFMKGKRMNQNNLVKFGESYFRREIVPQIIEEPIKGRIYENNVVVLDDRNYDEIVLDEDRDVVVLYYSDNCPYSQKVKPIYDYIGSKYLYQRQNITIAKFDAFNRKIPQSSPWKDLEYYPTIVVYPAIDKVRIQEEAQKQNATVTGYQKGAILYKQEAVRGLKEITEFISIVTYHKSRVLLNIMEIEKFDVDDEISSSEEEEEEEEDIEGDTALERARKRKEIELKKKEKLRKKEELKKQKDLERQKKLDEKKNKSTKQLPNLEKEKSSTKTKPAKTLPEKTSEETPKSKQQKDEL